MQTPEVLKIQKTGYSPLSYYNNNAELRNALDFIGRGIDGKQFDNIYNTLKNVDHYMALADYADYCEAHKKAMELYNKPDVWNKMSLVNIAKSGIFAADRSVNDYANNIWNLEKVK